MSGCVRKAQTRTGIDTAGLTYVRASEWGLRPVKSSLYAVARRRKIGVPPRPGENAMDLAISVDATVVTNDGAELGKVKEYQQPAFLVDVRRHFDYWLSETLVASATAERIELAISEADLPAYKMDNPHDHNAFMAAVPDKLNSKSVQSEIMGRRTG